MRMAYKHLTEEERSQIAQLKAARHGVREIGRRLGRSASTISREIARNRYPTDGSYKSWHAQRMYQGRRRRARQGSRLEVLEWMEVEALIRQDFSPEQVAGRLKLEGGLRISHETLYRYIWRDKQAGGTLYQHLRGARKQRRKGYGNYDSRGRLAGKRRIEDRPAEAEGRTEIWHWEVDTVHGQGRGSIATIVDRKTGYVLIGKLTARTASATNARLRMLMAKHPESFTTITADNGCEFHAYRDLGEETSVEFYFANPYHSWERGTNENTNGLIRQYLPKGCSMDDLSQARCNAIARKLNDRPRKRNGFRTPAELFEKSY